MRKIWRLHRQGGRESREPQTVEVWRIWGWRQVYPWNQVPPCARGIWLDSCMVKWDSYIVFQVSFRVKVSIMELFQIKSLPWHWVIWRSLSFRSKLSTSTETWEVLVLQSPMCFVINVNVHRLPESLTESGTITNPKLKRANLATTLVLLQIWNMIALDRIAYEWFCKFSTCNCGCWLMKGGL